MFLFHCNILNSLLHNSREQARNASLIIDMNGNSTYIKDPAAPKAEPKMFAFDYSYWSHDCFKEKADGYLEPSSSKYADQRRVFDDLGRGVLDNAWKGYNCSLFAYGQTGSGKSYSMVGYGNNKGIVPISCDELFKGIQEKKDVAQKGEEYQVSFSMLEIYNEQVRDLLNPKSLSIKGGLKVRQHPNKGFYVDGLTSVPVANFNEIDSKMNEGTKNRTVASTQMNATSSRAHTIVAINFTQKSPNEAGQSMTKSSSINLVDLAGSERAESTGATGDRLKEGSAINQSLSTLGNVIKALADQSGGNKKVLVPFRDSVLTKLLKNALGGNSKTVMIAALSPADINYEETLSTLRFADRAKAIKTTAVINESPTDKLIRELREENEKLKAMMAGGKIPEGMDMGGGAGGDGGNAEELKREMEEAMKRNQEQMEAMEASWQEKLKAQEEELKLRLAQDKQNTEDKKSLPHFWNLNEDAALTGMITHFCNPGNTNIGNNKAEKMPEIQLNGLGIQPQHAIVENSKNNKVMLKPCPGAKILLNGNEIKDKKELHHHDRILFGSNNLFAFHHPNDQAAQKKKKKEVPAPTFESTQEEIAKNSGLSSIMGGGKSKEDMLVQEDLIQIWPMINEANAMSEEMDKKTKFEVVLISPQAKGKKDGRTEVCVKVKNMALGNEFLWDRNTFINRKFLMQEMYQNYVEGDQDWNRPKESDPFWEDPNAEVFLGSVHVYLQSLAYMVELEENLTITDYKGTEQGLLQVQMHPCTKAGKDIGDDYVDDPSELVGRDYFFKLKVPHARGLPKKFVKSFCKFQFYLDDGYTKTNETTGMNPDFKFEKMFSFTPCTQQFVNYLSEGMLVIEVWGRQADTSSGAELSTAELMLKDKSGTGTNNRAASDHHYKMAAEANTLKKRMEKAEAKLKKIQDLCEKAKKEKKDSVKVTELEAILRSGKKLKAVATLIAHSQKAKNEGLGSNASKACTLQ
ncbi:hypothetical protein CAPTEDRAFT_171489 [Capitella teleta]|uniref:Kinesin-like protein n=1 Tax=Capitella teleta TaxID=283909 RepID=R7U3C2_CAPTE|nr:hypothetical protein CAPTEDRAFT_171489 [Capitella teleta]|eukprot:ELU00840.1 hypothetical protein CAPTEDRAFT_171489 [Capitella teleta]